MNLAEIDPASEDAEHKVTFYPVGNGDCSQVALHNGKRLLFDYCHRRNAEDDDDPKIDLSARLKQELAEVDRDYFDVVAFTHADDDHICNSTEFFYLEHAKKYQTDDRIKIKELWVPAAMILEEGAEGEDRVLREEARHRLRKGAGIRVFSKPKKLREWLENEGLKLEDRAHLITDAGQIVPGFTIPADGIELFAHSPFIEHCDGEDILRNEASLILHATFAAGDYRGRYLLVGDTTYDILDKIVNVTKAHDNEERLQWDLYNVPHHCSYKAIGPERGTSMTEASDGVEWLLDQGEEHCVLVSSSKPIDASCLREVQPPHAQAQSRYNQTARDKGSDPLIVTMEHGGTKRPKPVVVTFSSVKGCVLTKEKVVSAGVIAASARPPRAGWTV